MILVILVNTVYILMQGLTINDICQCLRIIRIFLLLNLKKIKNCFYCIILLTNLMI